MRKIFLILAVFLIAAIGTIKASPPPTVIGVVHYQKSEISTIINTGVIIPVLISVEIIKDENVGNIENQGGYHTDMLKYPGSVNSACEFILQSKMRNSYNIPNLFIFKKTGSLLKKRKLIQTDRSKFLFYS